VASTFYGEPLVEAASSGRTVLFSAVPPGASNVRELFVAPMHGRAPPVRVNDPLTSANGRFRPGASSVIYAAPEDEPDVIELYHLDPLVSGSGHARGR
jgi:hypothetical protein